MDLAQQQSLVFLAMSNGVMEVRDGEWAFPAERIAKDDHGQPQFTVAQWKRMQRDLLEKRPDLAAKPEPDPDEGNVSVMDSIPEGMSEDIPIKDEPTPVE